MLVKCRITINCCHNSTTTVIKQLNFYNITGYNFYSSYRFFLLLKRIQNCTPSSEIDSRWVDWQDGCQIGASIIAGKSVDESDEAFVTHMMLCVHAL